jgi:acyl-CoA reductase-like NAD-dependent aldehyde dehydrogenase
VNENILEIHNPATGAKLADVPAASVEDVRRAIEDARAAQARWAQKSFEDRSEILYRYRDLLIDHQEKMADLVTGETGKPRSEVYGNELFYLYDAIGFWAKHAVKYLKPENIRPHLFKSKKVVSIYSPIGVVGVIGPWNFPLVLTIGDAVPALMAGNAVIIKPSELTPLSASFAAELAEKAGWPEKLLQVLPGYGATAEALIDHADMILFTGSVETGKKVMRRAAERLIPVALELGGKDAMIVLKDADLDRAAGACVWGALMNSGQVCTSIERVYVEETVYQPFVDRVLERVRKLRQGPSEAVVELGSMTSSAQLDKVAAQIHDAVDKGAKILHGGRKNPSLNGFYYEPTVLVDVDHRMSVMTEETFGPVIPIMKVSDAEEAIRLANDSRYGLDGSVFTGDRERGRLIAERIDAGAVCVNDGLVNFVITEAPMGGVKQSGIGRRHGVEGIRKYCRQKTIVIDRFGMKSEPNWFPASKLKTQAVRSALRLFYRSGWSNKLFGWRRGTG